MSRLNTRALYANATNSIAKKGQGRNSLAGCRDSVPAGVKGQSPLRLPSTYFMNTNFLNSIRQRPEKKSPVQPE